MMPHPQEAARSRLERMADDGMIDAVAPLIRTAPILEEFDIKRQEVEALFYKPIAHLESAASEPSMLEAIIRAVGRPPLKIEEGVVLGKTSLSTDFPADVDTLIAGTEPMLPNVGRVEFFNHDMAWGGTAWVIGEDERGLLICTNRHVAALVARRTFRGDGVFMFSPANVPYGAQVDFNEEVNARPDEEAVARIRKFTYLAEDTASDVAIALIDAPSDGLDRTPLPLAGDDGEDGDLVAVVGYPARDSLRNDPTQMEQYFRGLYDVKRYVPGFLKVQPGVSVLSHDCTTLGGNSGSPVIRLEDRKVVGLHFAGRFAVGNSAVRASTLRALRDGTRPKIVQAATLTADEVERRDGAHDAAHFEGREGYDPCFLQVADVPLPKTPAHTPLARPSDGTDARPNELRYQHFSILYSAALKSPVLAAMNLDGSLARPQKRGSDKWYSDGRLPPEVQLGKEDYDDPAIDRGHLIRRAATNWGETDEIAKRANADSFHYTVASPQHMGFNRNAHQWLGLENYIMSSARTHGFRCSVFTGPIFSEDGSEVPLKDTGSPIPNAYFKLVTMLAEEPGSMGILRLHATAYVLSQGQLIQKLLIKQQAQETTEGFVFGAFKTFQVRIADLEEMSGFDFGQLKDADPLARATSEFAPAGRIVTVADYANIVL